MASLRPITTEDEFNSTLSTLSPSTLLVLYFHTPWAAPCAQMTTILTALASTYPATASSSTSSSSSSPTFLSINAEDLPEISETYDVTAVPFLVLVRDGKTLETVSGSDAGKVRAAVEKHQASPGSGSSKAGVAPRLEATPRPEAEKLPATNGATTDGATTNGATKDLSGYAPQEKDPKTAPDYSSLAGSKEELNTRLANLVKAAPVMLFMKGTPSAPQCGFSRQLVSMLRERQVKYGFFNILADDDVRQGLKEFSDWPTFPQLYTNGELIGGLDIVREELDSDPDFFKPFSAAAQAA